MRSVLGANAMCQNTIMISAIPLSKRDDGALEKSGWERMNEREGKLKVAEWG